MKPQYVQYLKVFLFCILMIDPSGTISSFDTLPEPQLPVLQIEDETAIAVAWSPDGTLLAVGNDAGVELYTNQLKLIQTFEQPVGQMKVVVWSPNGRYIASTGANDVGMHAAIYEGDKKVYVWDTESGEILTIFDEHTSPTYSLAWSPDGQAIASGSWDRTVKIWDPFTGHVLLSWYPDEDDIASQIMSISWSPNGEWLAGVVGFSSIYIWDTTTSEAILTFHNESPVPPNPHVVSWGNDSRLLATDYQIWDTEAETVAYTFNNCPISPRLDWSPDGAMIALFNQGDIYLCDIAMDTVVTVLDGEFGMDEHLWGRLYSIDWHPSGEYIAGALGDGFVRLWRVFEDETKAYIEEVL